MPRRPARAWGSVDRGKRRRAIELRKHLIPEAELVTWREGNTGRSEKRVASCSGGVREPGMCGHSSHGNRETSGRSLRSTEVAMAEATGKANNRTPVASSPEESDDCIVPEKRPNKDGETRWRRPWREGGRPRGTFGRRPRSGHRAGGLRANKRVDPIAECARG